MGYRVVGSWGWLIFASHPVVLQSFEALGIERDIPDHVTVGVHDVGEVIRQRAFGINVDAPAADCRATENGIDRRSALGEQHRLAQAKIVAGEYLAEP
jgi:hypothetical protein